MNITRNLLVAVLMTLVTTIILGVVYPLVVTGIAHAVFRDQANGQLIDRNGTVIGSRIIGQGFSCWSSTSRSIASTRPRSNAGPPCQISENRYPTHGSVRMYLGAAGLGSIFFRSEPTSTRRCSG